MLNAPNLFTLARLILAPFVAADIWNGHYGRAIVLFFIAGITDIIDGLLARRMGVPTKIGAYFDPIADKILLSVIYISLGAVHAIPWWIVWIIFGRDILILAMAAYSLAFTTLRKFPPSVWGKLSTFVQIGAALIIMGARAGIPVPDSLALWPLVAVTVWSGVHYCWRGFQMLNAAMKNTE